MSHYQNLKQNWLLLENLHKQNNILVDYLKKAGFQFAKDFWIKKIGDAVILQVVPFGYIKNSPAKIIVIHGNEKILEKEYSDAKDLVNRLATIMNQVTPQTSLEEAKEYFKTLT